MLRTTTRTHLFSLRAPKTRRLLPYFFPTLDVFFSRQTFAGATAGATGAATSIAGATTAGGTGTMTAAMTAATTAGGKARDLRVVYSTHPSLSSSKSTPIFVPPQPQLFVSPLLQKQVVPGTRLSTVCTIGAAAAALSNGARTAARARAPRPRARAASPPASTKRLREVRACVHYFPTQIAPTFCLAFLWQAPENVSSTRVYHHQPPLDVAPSIFPSLHLSIATSHATRALTLSLSLSPASSVLHPNPLRRRHRSTATVLSPISPQLTPARRAVTGTALPGGGIGIAQHAAASTIGLPPGMGVLPGMVGGMSGGVPQGSHGPMFGQPVGSGTSESS
jgi:hypothetical protein